MPVLFWLFSNTKSFGVKILVNIYILLKNRNASKGAYLRLLSSTPILLISAHPLSDHICRAPSAAQEAVCTSRWGWSSPTPSLLGDWWHRFLSTEVLYFAPEGAAEWSLEDPHSWHTTQCYLLDSQQVLRHLSGQIFDATKIHSCFLGEAAKV